MGVLLFPCLRFYGLIAQLFPEDAPGGDLLDLLRYAQTGKALGSLSRKIEAAVGRANEDREWVDKVWSVSTIVEN
ncbi:MAG: hypothetical protein ACLTL5_09190, partial [Oscillospiraceae bacterium]